jgi:hypothetical protein
MSNDDWKNPHDPDAKIGPTKAGAIDMIYKPEHTVDLDTGAILQAEVRLGHEADQQDLAAHVLQAQVNINLAQERPVTSLTIQSAAADKGYHAPDELSHLQREGIRTVISDPVKNRDVDKLSPGAAKAVRAAKRSVRSGSGKQLLKQRGQHLERSFAHVLDAGGARRTTLRGLENLNKRFKVSAAIYNLSQLMRAIWGVGTPKQWAAGVKPLVLVLFRLFVAGWSKLVIATQRGIAGFRGHWEHARMQLVCSVKYMVAFFPASKFSILKFFHKRPPVLAKKVLARGCNPATRQG